MKFSEVMKDERVNDWIEKYFYLFFIFLFQFKASGKPVELLHYIMFSLELVGVGPNTKWDFLVYTKASS